jgi:hypothetical protein
MESVDEMTLKPTSFITEGLEKLLPSNATESSYVLFLRGESNESDDEENRVADFVYWYADNGSQVCQFNLYNGHKAMR